MWQRATMASGGGINPSLAWKDTYDNGLTSPATFNLTSGKTYIFVYDQEGDISTYDLVFSGATELFHDMSAGYQFGTGHIARITFVVFKATSNTVTVTSANANIRRMANGMIFEVE